LGVQRIPEKTSALRPPRVFQPHPEIASQKLREAVLETLPRAVRERKVVGVRADSQGAAGTVRATMHQQRRCDSKRNHGQQAHDQAPCRIRDAFGASHES
jgi:hypothetical protein